MSTYNGHLEPGKLSSVGNGALSLRVLLYMQLSSSWSLGSTWGAGGGNKTMPKGIAAWDHSLYSLVYTMYTV